MLRQFSTGAHPHLTELLTHVALQPGYDYANEFEFEFGLDVILDAVDTLRAAPEGRSLADATSGIAKRRRKTTLA